MKTTTTVLSILVLLLGFLLGGFYFSGVSNILNTPKELADDFSILISEDFNPNKVTLHGISLNQSTADITTLTESFERDDGRIIYQTLFDDTAVVVEDSKVQALVIKNDALKQAGLTSRNNVIRLLGEPDALEDQDGFLDAYIYFDKKMIVRVIDFNPLTEEPMAEPSLLLTLYR